VRPAATDNVLTMAHLDDDGHAATKETRSRPSHHAWRHGWAAFGVTLLLYLGAAAGSSKACMDHFELDQVIGFILLSALLGGFIVPVLTLPALLIPARALRPPAAIATLCLFAIGLPAATLIFRPANIYTADFILFRLFIFGTIIISAVIGELYRRFTWMQRYGWLVGTIVALAIAVARFSSLPYGSPHNCTV